jgi:hypothetical protein
VVCYITTIQAPSPLPPAVLDKHRTPRGDGLEAVTALAQRVVRCLAAAQERRRVWAEPTTGVGSDDRARDEQAAVRKLRRRGTMGGGGSLPAGIASQNVGGTTGYLRESGHHHANAGICTTIWAPISTTRRRRGLVG